MTTRTSRGPAVTGIVLAGGESSRFGRPKWRARLAGATLLDRALEALTGWCTDVLVVGRGSELSDAALARSDVRFVEDLPLGRGPLVGLASGLAASRTALSAVVACDMPFADADLLRHLSRLARGYDAVVSRVDGRSQPLHAIYHRRCLKAMKDALARGVRAPSAFLREAGLRVRYVPDREVLKVASLPTPFFSVNTPRDLRRARDRLRRVSYPRRS